MKFVVGFGGEVLVQSTPGFALGIRGLAPDRFSHTFIGLKGPVAYGSKPTRHLYLAYGLLYCSCCSPPYYTTHYTACICTLYLHRKGALLILRQPYSTVVTVTVRYFSAQIR
jgi:hypothetical protein